VVVVVFSQLSTCIPNHQQTYPKDYHAAGPPGFLKFLVSIYFQIYTIFEVTIIWNLRLDILSNMNPKNGHKKWWKFTCMKY